MNAPKAFETSGTGLVAASRISKSFGGLKAVNDVTMSLDAGRIVGLIGPNGSGKTTLLNLLTGSLIPDAGAVLYEGEEITVTPPFQRARRGMVRLFQQSRIFPSLTLEENLRVTLGGASDDLVGELLEKVKLRDRARDEAGNLSYGQQRLLEFTRVLSMRPRVVLLDEPTAGVFSKTVETMRELICELRDNGIAVLIVEHNIDFVAGVSDRLVGLAEGSILVEGKPAEVLESPELIAAYFGDSPHSEKSPRVRR